MLRLLATLVLAGAASLASGCVYHEHRSRTWRDEWAHETAVSVRTEPSVVIGHVHSQGCGHYFWHGAWYDHAHPHDCSLCIAPPSRVIVESRPSTVIYAHPIDCSCHVHRVRYYVPPPRVSIGIGFGLGHGHYGGHGHYRGHGRYRGHGHR